MSNGKVALIILDGYGIGEPNDGNAIYMAQTPVMDGLLQRWPHTKLSASGLDVGLPDGQSVKRYEAVMTDGSSVPISTRKYAAIRRQITDQK